MKTFATGLVAALSVANTYARVLNTQVSGGDPDAFVRHAKANGQAQSEGTTTYDGVELASIPSNLMPQGRAALAPNAQKLSTNGWTATADSAQDGQPAQNVLDGNANTLWHTPWGANGAGLPHQITVDMKQNYLINTIAMQPRQDGNQNGNIGGHRLQTSTDGNNWSAPKVLGTWRDDASTKTSIFEATNARYVRLTSLTEAGGRGPWTSIAELNVYSTPNAPPAYGGRYGGEWSPTIDFPIVPVAAAVLYNSGNILTWSSYAADSFGGSPGGITLTATYFAGTQTVSQRTVTNTNHDMFCPGISINARGQVVVTGGNDAARTSIYTPGNDAWTSAPNMQISRGYQAQTTLAGGKTFTIGGSWSGGTGGKNGEIYSLTNNAWTKLGGALSKPLLTNDAQGEYRADNHAMLFGWKGDAVFQAGPSKTMNWYTTGGGGGSTVAGTRGNDGDAMCGIAVMYDAVAGKILVTGGAVNYQNVDATANAQIVTIGNVNNAVQTQTINPMWFKRIFASAVVLPTGEVFIVGGQVYGQPFSDDTSILTPEIWSPQTTNFYKLPDQNAARVYHSVALLLADGTVFSGGGGLCGGCATNHFDGQVYSPSYLFNTDGSKATRPVINSAPATILPGQTLTVNVNSGINSWSLVRLGSVTHTVNTDQRRVPLTGTATGGGNYNLPIPNDFGIVLPGYYWLFAINGNGVPSLGRVIQIPK